MINNKENKLDQIKQDLNEIETKAKTLHIKVESKKEFDDLENNTLVLTDILEKGNKTNVNLSNSEIILKLKDIKSIMEIQNKILSDLISKLS